MFALNVMAGSTIETWNETQARAFVTQSFGIRCTECSAMILNALTFNLDRSVTHGVVEIYCPKCAHHQAERRVAHLWLATATIQRALDKFAEQHAESETHEDDVIRMTA